MKKFLNIPTLLILIAAWLAFITSCANQGIPSGGDKDTIPPILVKSIPIEQAINYKGDKIQLTFNEFIRPDKISEMLVVSPPLEKRPTIRTKGKSIIISFNEELQDSVTYSLNFGNSIVDNNEGNPIEGFIYNFSTYNDIDTMRMAGKVIDAFTLNPIENTLVVLRKNHNDTAVTNNIPDYIAKTDKDGFFVFMNLKEENYKIFSFDDANSNYKYDPGAEKIAFIDSIYQPSATMHTHIDTTTTGLDSIMSYGHTHFSPDPIYLRQFEEYFYNQYLDSYSRNNNYNISLFFNRTVKDTFDIQLLNQNVDDWYQLEYNENKDSITVWITDTLIAKIDTLNMEVAYSQLNPLDDNKIVVRDTLEMVYTKPKPKKRKDKDKEKQLEQFTWKVNIENDFDLNKNIKLVSPQPIDTINNDGFHLYYFEDTLKTDLDFSIDKDTSAWRTYIINHKWQPETKYIFEIDSASSRTIYGVTNKEITRSFETRSEEYYGSIKVTLENAPTSIILQLLANDDNEKILQEKIAKNNIVEFNYLKPDKYRIKIIYDENGNDKWDVGSLINNIQPERVSYINEVIKIRSNWEYNSTLNLTPDPKFQKEVIDKEEEARKKKEEEEKRRKQKERTNRNEGAGRKNMLNPTRIQRGR